MFYVTRTISSAIYLRISSRSGDRRHPSLTHPSNHYTISVDFIEVLSDNNLSDVVSYLFSYNKYTNWYIGSSYLRKKLQILR